ncbi:MAG: hypothetical protein CMD14_09000 [Flavobacteriales bacterium]|nr:hypothetical protein [Flavobacteriales bacterium]|tara:strand:+ start:4181 stop:4501 length:321 start_codon:yes stop_codon:yes gene_type:complete
MNNITYTISELNNETISDSNDVNNDKIDISILLYNTYTVKQLNYIMQYYNISKGRMCKDEIIQSIIIFETDENNINIVNKRKYLWNMVVQLKNDEFFAKYVIIDIK